MCCCGGVGAAWRRSKPCAASAAGAATAAVVLVRSGWFAGDAEETTSVGVSMVRRGSGRSGGGGACVTAYSWRSIGFPMREGERHTGGVQRTERAGVFPPLRKCTPAAHCQTTYD
jgi:hypothetical protein